MLPEAVRFRWIRWEKIPISYLPRIPDGLTRHLPRAAGQVDLVLNGLMLLFLDGGLVVCFLLRKKNLFPARRAVP